MASVRGEIARLVHLSEDEVLHHNELSDVVCMSRSVLVRLIDMAAGLATLTQTQQARAIERARKERRTK